MSFRGETFTSHAQLDEYCNRHFETLSEQDKALLKAFDRAFWLRHNSQKVPELPRLLFTITQSDN